jgi:phage shock protein PspC (stress-responsive transcriptional regulator)
MYLFDILFTSFHGFARYPLYIISWICSISSLHHRANPWNDVKRISSKSMKWCKQDIEQVQEMMWRGYRISHFLDLLDILFTSFHGLARYPLYIILWICSISSLDHFMDLLDILFTSFHGLAGYSLYIILWTCSISFLHRNDVKRISSKSMKWCKEHIEQIHEMM